MTFSASQSSAGKTGALGQPSPACPQQLHSGAAIGLAERQLQALVFGEPVHDGQAEAEARAGPAFLEGLAQAFAQAGWQGVTAVVQVQALDVGGQAHRPRFAMGESIADQVGQQDVKHAGRQVKAQGRADGNLDRKSVV